MQAGVPRTEWGAQRCPGFEPKRPDGPLSRRCVHCGYHLDDHADSLPLIPQSSDEEQEILRKFKAADTNGDGVLSKGEITFLMTDLDESFSSADLDCVLSEMDRDRNGVIDVSEFVHWCFAGESKTRRLVNLLKDPNATTQARGGTGISKEATALPSASGPCALAKSTAGMAASAEAEPEAEADPVSVEAAQRADMLAALERCNHLADEALSQLNDSTMEDAKFLETLAESRTTAPPSKSRQAPTAKEFYDDLVKVGDYNAFKIMAMYLASENGPDPDEHSKLVNYKTHWGHTVLMAACGQADVKLVKKLMAAGADINAESEEGEKVLNWVLIKGKESKAPDKPEEQIIKMLVEAGAELGPGFGYYPERLLPYQKS